MADVAINFTGKVSGMNMTSKPGAPLESAYWIEWDWEGWIRKQIDYAISVGANTVRLIGDVAMVQNGQITQALYNRRTQQFVKYCVDHSLSVYYTGCATYGTDGVDNGTSALTDAQIAAIINSNIGSITGASGAPDYSANILGCDIVQEANALASASRVNNIYSLVKPNVPSPIGCTFSTSGAHPDATWISSIIGSCDYLDFHIYPQIYGITTPPTPTDFASGVMTTYANKDLLFGECGSDYDAGTSLQVPAWMTALTVLGMMAGSHARGAMAWAVFEQGLTESGQQYGFFDHYGPFTPLTDYYIYPWIRGWSTSSSPVTPVLINPHDSILLVDVRGASTDFTGVKFYRNGVLIGTPEHGYFDDVANVVPATQYIYTAKVTTASHGDSAVSSPLTWSLPASRVRL